MNKTSFQRTKHRTKRNSRTKHHSRTKHPLPNKTPNKTSLRCRTKHRTKHQTSSPQAWKLPNKTPNKTSAPTEQNTEQNKVRELPPNKTPNTEQLSVRTLNAEQNKHRTKTKKIPNKTPNTEHCSLNTEHRSGPVLHKIHLKRKMHTPLLEDLRQTSRDSFETTSNSNDSPDVCPNSSKSGV